MSLFRSSEAWMVGNVSFPITNYLFNRPGILRKFRQLVANDNAPPEQLERIQLENAKVTLRYAQKFVPYYTNLFREIDFDPEELTDLSQMRHIPPLSRDDLIDHRHELIDYRWKNAAVESDRANRPPGEPLPLARFRKKSLIRNRSSGSTGAPTIFYENGSITASNWANELRLRNWFGVKPGEREARLARVSAEYIASSKSVKLRRLLWNQLALPGVSLAERDFAASAEAIKRFQPRVLWGFTSALTGLAEFIESNGIRFPQGYPTVLITWAAPLYPHERALLERVFKCSVTNIYGTREVGHIAGRCELGHLHVNQESVYLEAENPFPSNDPTDDKPSELLATTLMPTPMPFIRYRMGDLGRLSNNVCECGRTLQVIEEFTGRTGEIFKTSDGRLIAPNFWCRTFMDPKLGDSIRRFQVVYRPNDHILLRIVRGQDYNQTMENHLSNAIRSKLFESASVSFEYPPEIAPRISGKYQMVVNESKAHSSPPSKQ